MCFHEALPSFRCSTFAWDAESTDRQGSDRKASPEIHQSTDPECIPKSETTSAARRFQAMQHKPKIPAAVICDSEPLHSRVRTPGIAMIIIVAYRALQAPAASFIRGKHTTKHVEQHINSSHFSARAHTHCNTSTTQNNVATAPLQSPQHMTLPHGHQNKSTTPTWLRFWLSSTHTLATVALFGHASTVTPTRCKQPHHQEQTRSTAL